jgi:hypothetical protein
VGALHLGAAAAHRDVVGVYLRRANGAAATRASDMRRIDGARCLAVWPARRLAWRRGQVAILAPRRWRRPSAFQLAGAGRATGGLASVAHDRRTREVRTLV